jgi:serine protease Do
MLSIPFRTAGKGVAPVLLAVFFSSVTLAGDIPLSSLENGMTELVYNLSRSVVSVECSRTVAAPSVGGSQGEVLRNVVSSGVVLDSEGTIVVAADLVAGQDRIMVDFDDQQMPARLVAVDYTNDLAIIRALKPVGEPAHSSDRQVCAGQMVVVVGNAYGMRASPTIGFCAGMRADGTLQFTAPITSGAIGGGVFDLAGRLIGVVVGTIGQGDRLAVAIPAYQLAGTVEYLTRHGDRLAGYIGVSTVDIEITPEIGSMSPASMAAGHGGTDHGVVVSYVVPGSPAFLSGVAKGDVILAFNNNPVSSAAELSRYVRLTSPGSAVGLQFVRRNSFFDIRLQVGRKQYVRPTRYSESDPSDDAGISPDSLTRVLDFLKQEVTRLERRLDRAR